MKKTIHMLLVMALLPSAHDNESPLGIMLGEAKQE
jgi:hypothetical protein